MAKPIFTMLVGIPGSGKSTWAKQYGERCGIHSSDSIRGELFGDEGYVCTPEENKKVFELLGDRVKQDLKSGKDVIYDATNLNKKKRIAFLKELKNIPCIKQCILFATDYDICLEQNKERERFVPEAVIKDMYTKFQPPHETEGWDNIGIVYNVDFEKYPANKADITTKDFDQGNKHHALSLDKHMLSAGDYVSKKTDDITVKCAAAYHDIGKLKTKSKGEDGQCHYYNHHCAGAYDSIFYIAGGYLDLTKKSGPDIEYLDDTILEISNLIYYHMHPFMSWRQSEKAKEKDKKIIGEKMFDKIMLIHEADLAAH